MDTNKHVNHYSNALCAIFGSRNVQVRTIHNDVDLCINSNHREILYAIKDFQEKHHDVVWIYSENICGKCLVIDLRHCDKYPNPSFDGILDKYKEKYIERIGMITKRYDKKPMQQEKRDFYESLKPLYIEMIAKPYVKIEDYVRLRELFERVRL